MKKIISFVVGLAFVFGLNFDVLAHRVLGNPLTNSDKQKIIAYFTEMSSLFVDPHEAIRWYKKADTGFFSDDYREVNVCNMQHLLRRNLADNFLVACVKLLLKSRKIAEELRIRYVRGGAEIGTLFLNSLRDVFNDDEFGIKIVNSISDYFDIPTREAAEACLIAAGALSVSGTFDTLAGLSLLSAFSFNVAACTAESLIGYISSLIPGLGAAFIAGAFYRIATDATQTLFEEQRERNCALVIKQFCDNIRMSPNQFLDSNLFVWAVDTRNFWSWVPLNQHRRNDSAWSSFISMTGLPSAPTARDYRSQEGQALMGLYLEMFRDIVQNSRIDFEALKRKLDGIQPIEFPLREGQN